MTNYSFSLALICSLTLAITAQQEMPFRNVAQAWGIDITYNNQSFGGGVSFCDFDGDGLDDLTFASSNGQMLYLFRNNGGGFDNIVQQTGITVAAASKTVLWLDYDNDGDKDFFVANTGSSSRLYRNEGGLSFSDVTAVSGIHTAPDNSIAACAGDYNNDGYLDLYVTNRSGTTSNYLYRNNGNGSFTDVTPLAGVADATRLPLAVAFLDVNRDGWQDIYIANDRMQGNTLFLNNGNGTFQDVSANSDAGILMDAMGIAIGDYDNDDDLDMYISNTESGNALLQNDGAGNFTNVAFTAGVEVNKICWGVNFLDYDNDTDLDLYVSVNHPSPEIQDVSNSFFENDGAGGFMPRADLGFQSDSSFSWGNAFGDLDNDGYYDLADLNSVPTKVAVWKSDLTENNRVKIRLQGVVSNRDAIGSIMEFHAGGKRFIRSRHCGQSYLSQNSSTEIVGIGSATMIDSVVVTWPLGDRQTHYNLAAGQTYTIIEGSAITGIQPLEQGTSGFELLGNYPNPFNPETTISYTLFKPGEVELAIYDVLGSPVTTLVAAKQTTGSHKARWDGRDATGNAVSSGLYVYRLQVDGFIRSGRMLLLK